MGKIGIFSRIRSYFRKLKDRRFRFGENPHTDWIIMLFVFIAVTAVLAYFSYDAQSVLKGGGGAELSDDSADVPTFLNEKILKSVLDLYEKKKADLESVILEPLSTPDPSL